MDEYIKKSDALKATKMVYIECLYLDEQEYEEAEADDIPVVFKRDIESIPAADVEEVRHGRWKGSDFIAGLLSCDKCGAQRNPNFKIGFGAWNYCPNCGAKMDGKENEDD